MFEGAVKRAFIDKFSRKQYRPSHVYRHKSLERMIMLAEKGLIEFEAPQEVSAPAQEPAETKSESDDG